MNYVCVKCGESFAVTAEQFGKRGKCPHCRATIIMPRLRESSSGGPLRSLTAPSLWMDRTFAGFVAIGLHGLILAVLALAPWREIGSGLIGSPSPVLIGEFPSAKLDAVPLEENRPLDILSPSRIQADEPFDPCFQSPLMSDRSAAWAESTTFSTLGGASSDRSLADTQRLNSDVTGGGQEGFGDLISRLKKEGLDIVITFDSTGSMGGEIEQVKRQIERIGGLLFRLIPKTRISICTYRDKGDKFVVKGLPLSDNLGEVVVYLETIDAHGGGDEPEAVEEGLNWSINQNKFRRQARKIVLLFGDAPPHASTQVGCLKLASDFRRTGGIVSTVTCRSAKRLDEFVEIAQLGGGESFLTSNERDIIAQLVVLVFGSEHREKVLELFQMMNQR